jgi:hypothetical protein
MLYAAAAATEYWLAQYYKIALALRTFKVGWPRRNRMAKGLYLTSDGLVLVEYGKRRRVPIPSAQYKANGYKPPCDKLPPEVPREARKELPTLTREDR